MQVAEPISVIIILVMLKNTHVRKTNSTTKDKIINATESSQQKTNSDNTIYREEFFHHPLHIMIKSMKLQQTFSTQILKKRHLTMINVGGSISATQSPFYGSTRMTAAASGLRGSLNQQKTIGQAAIKLIESAALHETVAGSQKIDLYA